MTSDLVKIRATRASHVTRYRVSRRQARRQARRQIVRQIVRYEPGCAALMALELLVLAALFVAVIWGYPLLAPA